MDLGRSPIVFSRYIKNRDTYDVHYLDKSPLLYGENTEFHNFQTGQYGSLSTPFKNCLDYTGPKGTGRSVYTSLAPNGEVTALRTMTIPESGVYTSTGILMYLFIYFIVIPLCVFEANQINLFLPIT